MNYQDYIKYDPEKKQYTDSYGYVIDGYSSKALGIEQRAQQPAKVNRITLVDTDSGIDPIVSTTGSDTVNLILDAKSAVKVTKSLVVGSSNTNQAWITTNNPNSVALQTVGTDALINVDIHPKSTTGYVKFASNYSKYISIMGGGNNKITTSQGTNADGDLTLESKGTGKLILTSQNTSSTQNESLDLAVDNGFSTFTSSSANPATYPNGDIKFVPRGLGIVDCKSGTMEWNRGIASGQVLNTGNNKVWFDNWISNSFPAGFISYVDIGGSKYDSFQNTSGRAIVLMVSGTIRETTTVSGRTLGLWIARSGDSSIRYGQVLLPSNGSDHNDLRALNSSSILKLAINEYFSLWAYTNDTGITIGGASLFESRPILSFRLMP